MIVLLKILKIFGIVLLIILGIIIAVLLLALFVPVRYKAKGQYKASVFEAMFNISYLFHIVSVSFKFKDNKPVFTVKIFGIPLKLGKKSKKIKTDDYDPSISSDSYIDNTDKKANISEDKPLTADDTTAESESTDSDTSFIKGESESKEEEIVVTDEIETESNDMADSTIDKAESEKEDSEADTDKPVTKKINNIVEEIEFYIKLLKSQTTKRAFEVCQKRAFIILKSISPKRGRINIWLGLDDTGVTGKIAGYYSALYAFIGKVVKLYPYYDRKITETDFNVSGRIYGCVIIYQGLLILINKNVRRLIKIIKKKK